MPRTSATRGGLPAIVIAGALAAGVMAPAGHAQVATCQPGAPNSLYCQTVGRQTPAGVQFHGTAPSADVCISPRSTFRLSMTITAGNGVRRVTVTLDGRTIKRQTSGRLRLAVGLRGLRNGVHTVKITVLTRGGTRVTRVLHFRICRPRPVPSFTG